MRVVLADPPRSRPPTTTSCASALARAAPRSSSSRSRFRFGEIAAPVGYRRSEPFYPLSSRVFAASRLRMPVKAAEHGLGCSRCCAGADVLHLQWLAAPELDRYLSAPRVPTVFTAHDLLPARTAASVALADAAVARSTASSCTASRDGGLAELGVDATVIPHPVFPSDPPRGRRQHAALARDDPAVQGPRRRDRSGQADRRERACSSPATRSSRERLPRASRRHRRVAARLSAAAELERALGEATVALFPYRPELDQSGALLQALGAGVPAVAYDVGGIAEPCGSSAPDASCRGRRRGAADAARELLDDATRSKRARRCAPRPRSADLGRRRRGAPRALRGAAVSFAGRASPT
jgi:hypothetical protein